MAARGGYASARFGVEDFRLYRSHLAAGGDYEELACYPLGANGRCGRVATGLGMRAKVTAVFVWTVWKRYGIGGMNGWRAEC